MSKSTDEPFSQELPVRALAKGFVAFRVFVGLVWLSNGLSKLTNVSTIDWGMFSFSLVSRNSARGIATDAAARSQIAPLAWFYNHVVLNHWGFFGVFLTITELLIGVALLAGFASRLAAVVGLLLIGPIWIMLWHTNAYLWEYPLDLFPLALLAVVPAGRVFGIDHKLTEKYGHRWPF